MLWLPKPKWSAYHILRWQAAANHILFYLVDHEYRAVLAVVGTDMRFSGHFVYSTLPDGPVPGSPLRCTNRNRVMDWLAQQGAVDPADASRLRLPPLAPHELALLESSDPLFSRPAESVLDRRYSSWREEVGVLPDGRHIKQFWVSAAPPPGSGEEFGTKGGDSAEGRQGQRSAAPALPERLVVVAEDSHRRDRRYTYRALPEFGGFVFENGHCAKEWLSFVVGRRLQPHALPLRPPRRKGGAGAASAAAHAKGGVRRNASRTNSAASPSSDASDGAGQAAGGAHPTSSGTSGACGQQQNASAAVAPVAANTAARAAAQSSPGAEGCSGNCTSGVAAAVAAAVQDVAGMDWNQLRIGSSGSAPSAAGPGAHPGSSGSNAAWVAHQQHPLLATPPQHPHHHHHPGGGGGGHAATVQQHTTDTSTAGPAPPLPSSPQPESQLLPDFCDEDGDDFADWLLRTCSGSEGLLTDWWKGPAAGGGASCDRGGDCGAAGGVTSVTGLGGGGGATCVDDAMDEQHVKVEAEAEVSRAAVRVEAIAASELGLAGASASTPAGGANSHTEHKAFCGGCSSSGDAMDVPVVAVAAGSPPPLPRSHSGSPRASHAACSPQHSGPGQLHCAASRQTHPMHTCSGDGGVSATGPTTATAAADGEASTAVAAAAASAHQEQPLHPEPRSTPPRQGSAPLGLGAGMELGLEALGSGELSGGLSLGGLLAWDGGPDADFDVFTAPDVRAAFQHSPQLLDWVAGVPDASSLSAYRSWAALLRSFTSQAATDRAGAAACPAHTAVAAPCPTEAHVRQLLDELSRRRVSLRVCVELSAAVVALRDACSERHPVVAAAAERLLEEWHGVAAAALGTAAHALSVKRAGSGSGSGAGGGSGLSLLDDPMDWL
ncbi:hypothetical protein HXX76_008646 [Chlamydomonas incerta]|uniref:TFIIS N-terminal domain-containing protein n=1 Tax=Chlamydomonas incerta TaxID=51695 RepID=A0A835SW64_CHLIN|nr:hypothetical protein HXX76_008646 [Chlamydomonas incerta]|eukprot:KAG2432916.1 hypothetical protein HXX76_008646 [Chlamydomonas incerta]